MQCIEQYNWFWHHSNKFEFINDEHSVTINVYMYLLTPYLIYIY